MLTLGKQIESKSQHSIDFIKSPSPSHPTHTFKLITYYIIWQIHNSLERFHRREVETLPHYLLAWTTLSLNAYTTLISVWWFNFLTTMSIYVDPRLQMLTNWANTDFSVVNRFRQLNFKIIGENTLRVRKMITYYVII